ncbi:efflux transporter outer membrane subunit [Rhodobacteraceae bacterium NNCM2]|nr:efflux transporter outer membrane subunit [Coraliihabitans acroporae]
MSFIVPSSLTSAASTLTLLVGISGCTMVGPDFSRPTSPVVDQWLQVNQQKPDETSGLTSRSEPVVAWWESFHDPVLNKLIAEAYAQNLDLQIAGARVLQARAQLGIAFGEMFPQSQSIGASYTRRRISENIGPISDVQRRIDFDPSFGSVQVGFDATWELDLWGGQRREIESAEANLASQVAGYDDALVTLTGEVAAIYINVRALQELIKVVKRNIQLQRQAYGLTELRHKNGVTTELDVQESATLLNNTKALLPGLESDLQQAKNALAVLLAKAPGEMSEMLGEGEIPHTEQEIAVGIPAALLRRRPDIRAAEMEAAAQSAQIGVAINDLYPQFVLTGAIGVQASDAAKLFTGTSITSLISPGIFWNILNYGRIKDNVRAQDAAFQGLVANYQNTVLSAYAEVENAMVAWAKAGETAEYYRISQRAANRAAKIAVEQYSDGLADYTRVLNTQEGALAVAVNEIETRAQISENLVAMYKALGGGWQVRQDHEFLPETVLAEMAHRTDWGDLLREDPEGMKF